VVRVAGDTRLSPSLPLSGSQSVGPAGSPSLARRSRPSPAAASLWGPVGRCVSVICQERRNGSISTSPPSGQVTQKALKNVRIPDNPGLDDSGVGAPESCRKLVTPTTLRLSSSPTRSLDKNPTGSRSVGCVDLADHRPLGRSGLPSEPARERARRAKPSVEERPKAAVSRRNGMSVGSAPECPEGAARGRAAVRGACPTQRKGERTGEGEARTPRRAVWSVVLSRWSA